MPADTWQKQKSLNNFWLIIENLMKDKEWGKVISDGFQGEVSEMKKALANAGSPVKKDVGGIDLRNLPKHMVIEKSQAQGPKGSSPDLIGGQSDKEWLEIERMLNAGIIPSGDRLKKWLEESNCQDNQIDKVLTCIADILRIEEDNVSSTAPELKDFLAILESGKSQSQLKLALNNINFAPREPELVTP